jgi:hypothetical protein
MAQTGKKRWIFLVISSFLLHTTFMVQNTASALRSEQVRTGNVLVKQLAETAAPLLLANDMVSLSVLAARYDHGSEHDSPILRVQIYDTKRSLLAETGSNTQGKIFSMPIILSQQALGTAYLTLQEPEILLLLRQSLGIIFASALLHGLMFLGVLILQKQATPTTPTNHRSITPTQTIHEVEPVPDIPTPSQPTPEAAVLHIAIADPNHLLHHVNEETAQELFTLLDQFIDRIQRLYGCQRSGEFTDVGVLLAFNKTGHHDEVFHAIAAGHLFLQLLDDAREARSKHGLLCLDCKLGLLPTYDDEKVKILAHTAPPCRILTIDNDIIKEHAQLGQIVHLSLNEQEVVDVALIEDIAPEYRQLIISQSQHILGQKNHSSAE